MGDSRHTYSQFSYHEPYPEPGSAFADEHDKPYKWALIN